MAIRALARAGRSVRLMGVESYSRSTGGDQIFQEIETLRPGVVLMESFAVDAAVEPGGTIPYRTSLQPVGLSRVLERVATPNFRESLTAEAVAALTALRVGAEVRMGDRYHSTSFDRLIGRQSLDELRHALVTATEVVASSIEERCRSAVGGQDGVPRPADAPQNIICPLFRELSFERHLLMAHFARKAADDGHDVAVVVGKEHVQGIADNWDTPADIDDLLGQGALMDVECGSPGWETEFEKRVAVAAFLASTATFPVEAVLPDVDVLVPDAKALAQKLYPKYRSAFMGRISQALTAAGAQKGMDLSWVLGQVKSAQMGLPQLEQLCNELSSV